MENKFFGEEYEKIKLIIWDLDDTFWLGTISEEEITPKTECMELVKYSIDKGVMNSICSKNDFDTAMNKLKELNVDDLFVFPSIDWTSKGARIKNIIDRMKLREQNVLFIDDNKSNLQEAKYICPDIMTLEAFEIKDLLEFLKNQKSYKDDLEHKRLKQYKLLEIKEKEIEKIGSNDEFLRQSNIRIYIDKSAKDIERIAELIERSNQLNFTKNRVSKEELEQDLSTNRYEKGAVYVKDNYGDYGLAGYYQLDKETNRLKHFLFSCRTIGMGVEQFVYQYLNYPDLDVVGQVVNTVNKRKTVDWIKSVKYSEFFKDNKKSKDKKQKTVLFKGPCDLNSILPMINGVKIDTEFSFVNKQGATVCAFLHSSHILESEFLTEEQKQEILNDVPFMDKGDFENKMFSPKYSMVFYSLLTDVHQGIYKHKTKGYEISFLSRNYSLTDKNRWNKYISGDYENTFKFTEEILEKFSNDYEFIGALSTEKIIQNIKKIRELMPKETVLVLISGSELEAEVYNEEFNDHARYYQELNKALDENFSNSTNIKIIKPSKYITDQSCLNGCTNHYSKLVYHKMALECSSLINEALGGGGALLRLLNQTLSFVG